MHEYPHLPWIARVITAACLLVALAAPGFAGAAGVMKEHEHNGGQGMPGGNVNLTGCPRPDQLGSFLVDNNLQANFTNDPGTRTSTYSFGSSLTGGGSTGGIPGLIEYCVYPSPTLQPLAIAPGVNGASGAAWIFNTGTGNFSFVRPNGDVSNIPLDGNSRIMGTATWDTLPTVQTLLLHISDPVVCARLYEEQGHDKDHDKDHDKGHDHHKDSHDEGGHGMGNQIVLGSGTLGNNDNKKDDHDDGHDNKDHHDGDHDKDHRDKKEHGDKDHKDHDQKLAGTCFVKPVQSQTPVCNQGDTTLAYNAMPFGAVNCGNPGLGFEAQAVREFGDQVALSPTTGRALVALKVLFASYGCSVSGHWNTGGCVTTPGATFNHPITANIYAVDNSGLTPRPGALLATVTQTQTIPYRPTSSNDLLLCPAGGDAAAGARWFNPLSGLCQNSISTVLTFNFPSGITLPDQVIWTVAYNTSTAGYNPLGTGAACNASAPGCPYDSLNVGTKTHPNAPYAGTDVDPNGAFLNSSWSGAYCDKGAGGAGFLRLDTLLFDPNNTATACWNDFKPEGAIVTQ